MTKEQVLEVLDEYWLLLKQGRSIEPVRKQDAILREDQEAHLLWMLTQIGTFLNENRLEKAMRWLGFIQGALWSLGIRSVEQMKKDNMPPEEVFEKDRI